MSWFIEGDGDKLYMNISDSADPEICGNASSSEPRPVGGPIGVDNDIEFLLKLGALECAWEILPVNASPFEIDLGNGFYERSIKAPETNHASISYFPEFVGVSIVLPPCTFEKVWALFHDVLLEPCLRYSISLGFLGFNVEPVSTGRPTIKEFVNGKPYLQKKWDCLSDAIKLAHNE